MATTKVDVNLISATGTASSSTFLRGDSSWNTPDAGGFTLGTEQATTSGTSITFSSIPSGTTVVHMQFYNCGNTTGALLLQLGDSGGIETSSYLTASGNLDAASPRAITNSTGFCIDATEGAAEFTGLVIFSLKDSSNFEWVSLHAGANHTGTVETNAAVVGGGHKALSAELTQIKLSGGTFDSGSVNISYS